MNIILRGDWFYLDNEYVSADLIESSNIKFINSIYEVLRIIGGKPLFVEEHYERLSHSLTLFSGFKITPLSKLTEILLKLSRLNNIETGNIRIEVLLNENKTYSLFIRLIPHSYPTIEKLKNGAHVTTFNIERNNPHIKQSLINDTIRKQIRKSKIEENSDEVLLMNRDNEITEGSKSNIFFIKKNVIYTPNSEKVLEGITRMKILEIIHNEGFQFIESPIVKDDIRSFEACFLTSTSFKILPVFSINSNEFDVNHIIIQKLIEQFDELVINNINKSD